MRRLLLTVAATLVLSSPASAQFVYSGADQTAQLVLNGGAFILNATDQGWVSSGPVYNGYNSPLNTIYFTGTPNDVEWLRSFFSFDMTGLPVITSAALRLNVGNVSGAVAVSFHDFLGNESDLFNNVNHGATFADLGNGAYYGSRSYDTSDEYLTLDVTLNAAAVSDINNVTDGYYTLGGRLNFDNVENQVTPEPTTMILLGSGLAGIAARRRRRAAASTI